MAFKIHTRLGAIHCLDEVWDEVFLGCAMSRIAFVPRQSNLRHTCPPGSATGACASANGRTARGCSPPAPDGGWCLVLILVTPGGTRAAVPWRADTCSPAILTGASGHKEKESGRCEHSFHIGFRFTSLEPSIVENRCRWPRAILLCLAQSDSH